jgi:hypothetical protein
VGRSRAEVAYFEWLVGQVELNKGRVVDKTYWMLFDLLHSKEFVWIVANDDNRIEDGCALRHEFGIKLRDGCSVLEVLIGLSRRVAFEAGGDERRWAWVLLENLGLHRMSDQLSPRKIRQVEDILDALIFRNYFEDGRGGFFPLAWPDQDQTKVEIWYQLNAYVSEMQEP